MLFPIKIKKNVQWNSKLLDDLKSDITISVIEGFIFIIGSDSVSTICVFSLDSNGYIINVRINLNYVKSFNYFFDLIYPRLKDLFDDYDLNVDEVLDLIKSDPRHAKYLNNSPLTPEHFYYGGDHIKLAYSINSNIFNMDLSDYGTNDMIWTIFNKNIKSDDFIFMAMSNNLNDGFDLIANLYKGSNLLYLEYASINEKLVYDLFEYLRITNNLPKEYDVPLILMDITKDFYNKDKDDED